jgi:hypothetical protein
VGLEEDVRRIGLWGVTVLGVFAVGCVAVPTDSSSPVETAVVDSAPEAVPSALFEQGEVEADRLVLWTLYGEGGLDTRDIEAVVIQGTDAPSVLALAPHGRDQLVVTLDIPRAAAGQAFEVSLVLADGARVAVGNPLRVASLR